MAPRWRQRGRAQLALGVGAIRRGEGIAICRLTPGRKRAKDTGARESLQSAQPAISVSPCLDAVRVAARDHDCCGPFCQGGGARTTRERCWRPWRAARKVIGKVSSSWRTELCPPYRPRTISHGPLSRSWPRVPSACLTERTRRLPWFRLQSKRSPHASRRGARTARKRSSSASITGTRATTTSTGSTSAPGSSPSSRRTPTSWASSPTTTSTSASPCA